MGELVPMKYRYFGNAWIYLFGIPGSGFGPAISYAFVQSPLGWRGVYWLLLALNGLAFVLWTLFYFPPSFHKKHRDDIDSKMYWVKVSRFSHNCKHKIQDANFDCRTSITLVHFSLLPALFPSSSVCPGAAMFTPGNPLLSSPQSSVVSQS